MRRRRVDITPYIYNMHHRCALLNKQDDVKSSSSDGSQQRRTHKEEREEDEKAGHAHYIYYHLLHLHIKFNGFINIFELLILFPSVRMAGSFHTRLLVQCPSSTTHCRHIYSDGRTPVLSTHDRCS